MIPDPGVKNEHLQVNSLLGHTSMTHSQYIQYRFTGARRVAFSVKATNCNGGNYCMPAKLSKVACTLLLFVGIVVLIDEARTAGGNKAGYTLYIKDVGIGGL